MFLKYHIINPLLLINIVRVMFLQKHLKALKNKQFVAMLIFVLVLFIQLVSLPKAMAVNVPPPNYPSGSTDEEIHRIIKEYSQAIISSGVQINSVLQFSPIILLGQNELQKRTIEKMQKVNEKNLSTIEKIKEVNEKSLLTVEQLKNETAELKKITHESSVTSEKLAKDSLNIANFTGWLTLISVGIALLSVLLFLGATWLTIRSDKSNKKAYEESLFTLKNISTINEKVEQRLNKQIELLEQNQQIKTTVQK